jgi:hypothetical protein
MHREFVRIVPFWQLNQTLLNFNAKLASNRLYLSPNIIYHFMLDRFNISFFATHYRLQEGWVGHYEASEDS